MTTILTLMMNAAAQERFDALRTAHYPAAFNRIAAHLTMFHTLPAGDKVRRILEEHAGSLRPFSMEVSSVRTLGRGVAYFLESPELKALHRRLATEYESFLSPQDRQGFRPHVVVQNKADPAEARQLHALLSAGFQRWSVMAEGLQLWNYLGGPWELRESFRFGAL